MTQSVFDMSLGTLSRLDLVWVSLAIAGFLGCQTVNLSDESYDLGKYERFRRQFPADLVSHFPPQVTEDHQPARLYYRAGGLGASRALQLKMSVTECEAQRLLEHYRERGSAELHGWPEDPDAERFIPDETTTLYPTDMTEVPPHLLTDDESTFILVGSEPKDPDPFYCGGVVISPKNRTVRYFAETDRVK